MAARPGGGGFEVWVPDLHKGAGNFRDDAAETDVVKRAAVNASQTAQGGCGGERLARALSAFAAAWEVHAGDLAEGARGAGDLLAANANRYDDDDAAAARALRGVSW